MTEEQIKAGLDALQTETKAAIADAVKATLEKSNAEVEKANAKIAEIEAEKTELTRRMGELEKKTSHKEKSQILTFSDLIGNTIRENYDALKGGDLRGGKQFEVKAVGDMSSANFSGTLYNTLTTDVAQSVVPLMQENIWLRDYLPSGTMTNGAITFPVENGGEGGVAPWTRGTPAAAKPQADFDFTSKTISAQWLAAYVKIPREMLDDIKWLESFLRTRLMQSLRNAENTQILKGNGSAPNLEGINTIATSAGTSTYVNPIERILEAAYVTVPTDNFTQANLAILNPADAFKVLINKATASGEYDLPPASIGWQNGRLVIGGLTVVTTTAQDAGTFTVGDSNSSTFLTRMSPEIIKFDQNEDDAKKNMIMVRC